MKDLRFENLESKVALMVALSSFRPARIGDDLQFGDEIRSDAYRLVPEGLTNVARHAGATEVVVSVGRSNHELLITISDNGRGIDPADLEKPESLGLVGMRERVWAMKGEISIGREEVAGTRIDISLPIPA